MELNNEVYNIITKLSKQGDELADKEQFEAALYAYNKAFEKIPEPVYNWEAATWLLTAIGDMYFQLQKFDKSIDCFLEAQKCPNGIGNPFICVRIGECFFEQNNARKAKEYLLQAYMLAGEEVFADANPKYLEFLSPLI
jgi:tetratricopeptide (TPR) repeat protein